MIKPNLFIIGAPKCGTTALAEYLRTHPDIFISDPKEPHYFSTDVKTTITNTSKYLELFEGTGNKKIRGEASVWYLFSIEAIGKILEFNPDAKFIVMIRNPIEQARSLHAQLVSTGRESESNFDSAWLKSIKNKKARHPLTAYEDVSALGSQLECAMQQIPKEQLHIIVFDDLVKNTRREYTRLLKFLNVKDDGRTEFPKVNPGKVVRSNLLHKMGHGLPKPLVNTIFGAKRLLGIKRLNITKRLRAINTKVGKTQNVNPETYKQMREVFMPEIHKLEQLLNRDFSHWLEKDETTVYHRHR